MVATVDDEDYEWLSKHNWQYDGRYAVRSHCFSNKSKKIYMHREVMGITDPRIKVDHRYGNKLCNERWNLRIATDSQNTANRSSPNVSKTSKYKGVSWSKHRDKWYAVIKCNNIKVHIGVFDIEIEAALAYNNNKAKELFGEFAYLNTIKEVKE